MAFLVRKSELPVVIGVILIWCQNDFTLVVAAYFLACS